MVLKVLIVIAVLVVALLAFAATKPRTFQIQRSIVVNASPAQVFGLIDDLHNWPRWAPQDRDDATMTRTFGGSPSGVGAVSEWQSKGSAGKGRMMITEAVPAARVTILTEFIKPLKVHNMNEFVFEPRGNQTKVTWSMHGPNLYMMKMMSVFVNMDRMMGKHFESGLANLKREAEK